MFLLLSLENKLYDIFNVKIHVKFVFDRSHKAKANKNARKAHGTIKYNGAKLNEKGVILEIEGLKPNQSVPTFLFYCESRTFTVNLIFLVVKI